MTFYKLLSEYDYIQIPIIQRDYVQGRASSDRQLEDREIFICNLLDATLPDSVPCHLDFIYGSCDNVGKSKFFPLDGQQRLTTLFLLHWLLLIVIPEQETAEKDKKRRSMLKKFTYKTRLSSETFCRKILGTEIIRENNDPLSIALRYQGWFGNDMKCDPTVQAMLEMIGAMEALLLKDKYVSHLTEMKENLFNEDCVTFNILDLNEYNLTDGLYVKMNARGKELTEFENWKAEFIEFLSRFDKKWKTTYKENFQDKIEHEWHDLFWSDVYKKYKDSDKSQYPRIDEHFITYFQNLHRMLFFLKNGISSKVEDFKRGTKSQLEEVFGYIENDKPVYLDFLFDCTNWLYKVHDSGQEGMDRFFSSIFQNGTPEEWVDKVYLFGEGNDELNLFKRFVGQSKSVFEGYHVLLYCILKYGIQKKVTCVDDTFRGYVRECRNFLESKSYFDHASLLMQSQIRVTDMAEYDHAFDGFINTPRKKSELRKRIEDLPYTHGDTIAFEDVLTKVETNNLKSEVVINAIYNFNSLPTLDKIKVLLSNGYKGVYVGSCSYGKRIFLGSDTSRNNEKISHWDVVFRTKESVEIGSAVTSFVERYSKNIELRAQISSIDFPRTPLEYMLKYDDILCAQVPWRSDAGNPPFYFYAMQDPWDTLDMISIHSYSGNPLAAAYQVCPMAHAVARRVSFKGEDSFHYVGHASEKAGLWFTDLNENTVFSMKFGKMEWNITVGRDILPHSILSKYNIDESFVLRSTKDNDLVQIATNFLEEVYKELCSSSKFKRV